MNYGARHSCNDTDSVKTYNDRCIKEAIENVPVKLLTQFTSIDVEEFAKELADWFYENGLCDENQDNCVSLCISIHALALDFIEAVCKG